MTLADILDAIESAERALIAEYEALPDDVRNHYWIAKPTLSSRYIGQPYWSMSKVVAGARRNWKRSAK